MIVSQLTLLQTIIPNLLLLKYRILLFFFPLSFFLLYSDDTQREAVAISHAVFYSSMFLLTKALYCLFFIPLLQCATPELYLPSDDSSDVKFIRVL